MAGYETVHSHLENSICYVAETAVGQWRRLHVYIPERMLPNGRRAMGSFVHTTNVGSHSSSLGRFNVTTVAVAGR